MGRASDAFGTWVAEVVRPIARGHGLSGTGPTFRKRDGDNWRIFALERRPIDPLEAGNLAGDRPIEFRMVVGLCATSARPQEQPRRSRPPGMRDVTMYSENRALDPPEGDDWHAFLADDPQHVAALSALVADGLGPALAGLGDTSARGILERRLPYTGPLENLSPHGAAELLAMADAAGDTGLRAEIDAALERDRVPDPMDAMRGGWVPPIGRIDPPIRPKRLTRRALDRLLTDLQSDRMNPRRIAARRLGGWEPSFDVLSALRLALDHPDAFTRASAALSLGHLRDADEGTWQRVLALADDPEDSAWDLGAAVVLLARLDLPRRRPSGEAAIDRLRALHPEWSPDLRAFKEQLATM